MDKEILNSEDPSKLVEEFEEHEVEEVKNTVCRHFYVEDPRQDPNTNMISVMCKKCWHGAMIDPSSTQLIDGKLVYGRH